MLFFFYIQFGIFQEKYEEAVNDATECKNNK